MRFSAWNVDRLKKSVPASWMSPAHQANRSPDWRNCKNAADVKKMEPTKYVTPSAFAPTRLAYGGKAPSAKHVDPTMKRVAIHHDCLIKFVVVRGERNVHRAPPAGLEPATVRLEGGCSVR